MPRSEAAGGARAWVPLAFGHLAVLWAFAIVQPLLDVLGDTPEFFVARGNTRGDILLLAFGLTVLPPAALVGVELLVSRLRGARPAVHLAFVAILSAAIALQALERLVSGLGAAAAFTAAAAAGALAAFAYARRQGVRSFLTALTPAPAVFLALFLLFSPVSDLVLPQDEVSARGATGGAGAPVVMVIFDEFSGASLLDRRGRLDAVRYPGFARLAAGSTWYPNATAVDFSTERAVPAVLTGTQPSSTSLPIAAQHPHSLFTLLGARYEMRVQEPATEVCPESLCGERVRKESGDRLRSLVDDLSVVSLRLLAPEDLEEDLPAVDTTFEGFRDPGDESAASAGTAGEIRPSAFRNRPAQFERFLGRIEGNTRRPVLNFIHLALPHWPSQYFPSGQQYPSDTARIPGLDGSTWRRDPFPVEQGYQRYLAQLGYTDSLVGKLIDRLRSEGLWKRALVVVAADHGVSFRPGLPRRVTTRENFPDIASVPLFIKAPGQTRGRVDESAVRTLDILPTIQDLLDLRSGWRFDGRSARAGITGRARVSVLTGDPVTAGFERFKLMRDAEVRRRVGLFGEGDRAGSFRDGVGTARLVGRRPGALAAAAALDARADVEDLSLLGDVDPGGPVIPAFIRGSVRGAVAPGLPIAVSLNGSIAAVVPLYRDGGELRFSALIDPSRFRSGRNAVALYALDAGGRSLARLPTGTAAAPRGELVERGDTTSVRVSGRTLEVEDGRDSGFLEKVTAPDPVHLEVAGWAAGGSPARAASRVLVFADAALVGSARPDVERRDVATARGPRTLLSGYRIGVPTESAEALVAAPARVRVIAVIGGRAFELGRLKPGS